MGRIRISILKDYKQCQIKKKDLNPYGSNSNLDSKEFARTTGFESPLYRFKSLGEEEVETRAKDSKPRKKDLIPLKEFSNRSGTERS